MNESIKMSVSSMTRHGEDKAIYVLFTDEEKSVEFKLPDYKILNNKGFTVEELHMLKDYVESEYDRIYQIAKEVDPIKSFLGLADTKEKQNDTSFSQNAME